MPKADKPIDAPIEVGDFVCRKGGTGEGGLVKALTPGGRKAIVEWEIWTRTERVWVKDLEQF